MRSSVALSPVAAQGPEDDHRTQEGIAPRGTASDVGSIYFLERVSDEPSPYSEEYGREPAPSFDSRGNEHRRHHQIRKRQDHHSDLLNDRSITRPLPEEFIDGTATSENIRPECIFLARFDRFYV